MRLSLLLLVSTIAISISLPAQESPCAIARSNETKVLREFLQEQQGSRQSPCLPSAIKQLGRLHDTEAVRLLVGYLDYLDPATAPSHNGGATVRPSYPAVSALFQIGEPATIDLLSAIQTGESQQTLENAVKAYTYIYRENQPAGIRALKTAELLAKTDDGRRRLNEARQKLVDECNARGEKESLACKAAASG